ncbi:Phosphatidylglycerol/phosphatidylinositol transfer protein, partial [Boothiomyces sp. JEL0838]
MQFTKLAVLASATLAQTFADCPSSVGQTTEVYASNISPYPMQKGKNVTITTSGTNTAEIVQGANIEVSVFKGKIRIYHTTLDFCEQSALSGTPCPIPTGNNTLVVTQLVPSIIPAGNYLMQISATNGDASKTFINCIQSTVQ